MSNEEKQSEREEELRALAEAGQDTFFADAAQPQAKPEKTGGMSKNAKGLIAGVAALVLLGGGLTAALLLTGNDDAQSGNDGDSTVDTTEAAEMISLNESLAEDVTKVEISGADDFTVYRVSEATEDAKAVYSIKGLEDIPLNENLLSTVVNNASSLSANQLVEENASDLSKYGLADPAADVTMQYADGAQFSFAVGAVSPMDSTMTYCAVDGDVYLVKSSLMANYQKESLFFVSTTILEEPAEADYPIVDSVRIQREDLDYDIYLEYDYENENKSSGGTAASHIMREPIFAYLNVEKSVDVTNGMFGLSAFEVVSVHPTTTELKDAGIMVPFCTVTMKCDNGKTYTLNLGTTYTSESGTECYYAYLDGTDVLYGVSETAAVWATMEAGDITSANIFGTMVWNIATLDVTVNGKTLAFEGEGDDDDNYVVTKNGEPCETERFRLFYRFLLGIYGEELCLGEELPDREPDASVHVVTQDGSEDYTVAFYKLDNLNMMVTVNDQPSYKIRTSCLDAIEHNIDIFDTNEEFTTTWR